MTSVPAQIAAVLKAYDVRGTTPQPLSPDVAAAYAVAFAERAAPPASRPIVLGRDVRRSSTPMADAVMDALTRAGWDVWNVGVCATDVIYFVSGEYDLPGIMITASHNPADQNGLKFCLAGARPIGRDDGLAEIAERAATLAVEQLPTGPREGRRTEREVVPEYAARMRELVALRGRRLRVVVDAANAVAGFTVPAVFADSPIDVVPLYFEPDGSFPNHEPNPLAESTLESLRTAVRDHRADAGLAFDGDADRCFVVDESGELVTGSTVTALIAERMLRTHPGATVLYNVICSRSVAETIDEHGGIGIRTPVGHSLIKNRMAETGARFGGEHSGHFYFADFFLADSGTLAALHVLAELAASDRPLSELVATYQRYASSGEINSTVGDQQAAIAAVERIYGDRADVRIDHLDGVTVSHPDWWFNVRGSNTEPLLRLNVEAVDEQTMVARRDHVLSVVRDL